MLHPFFDFGGCPGHEGNAKGLVAFLLCFAVGGAGAAYAAVMVFEAEGFVCEEVVDEGLGGGSGALEEGVFPPLTGFQMARRTCFTPKGEEVTWSSSIDLDQPRMAGRT